MRILEIIDLAFNSIDDEMLFDLADYFRRHGFRESRVTSLTTAMFHGGYMVIAIEPQDERDVIKGGAVLIAQDDNYFLFLDGNHPECTLNLRYFYADDNDIQVNITAAIERFISQNGFRYVNQKEN